MKLYSFKFSPFLACLLGLSVPNTSYSADAKKTPTTKQVVKKNNAKPKTPVKKITNNAGKKDVEKKDKNLKSKDLESENKNDEKSVTNKSTTVSEKVVKTDDASKVNKVVNTVDAAVAPEKINLTEEKNAKLEKKDSSDLKTEPSVVKTEKNDPENLPKEDKNKKNSRRRRRGSDLKKEENVSEPKDSKEQKKENDKKTVANSRKKNRKKKLNSENEELAEVKSKKDISEEEIDSTPRISAGEYLDNISNLVSNYSGTNVQRIETISKLSGKNLDWFRNTYKNYDVNGNPKLKKNNIQFKNQLIRRIDLREKVNLPFFRSNKEITKYFLNGISEGKLIAFFDPFLTQKMTNELLKEQLLMPKDVEASASDEDNVQELFFDAHDVSALEIISNWIFDKNTSAFSEDPTIIKLIIPAEKFSDTTKIQRVVCFIRYSDALTFLKNIPEAAWIDEQNEAVVLSIGEAFSMGLFDSSITFLGNRDCNNGEVVDRWGSKENDPSFAARKAEDFKYKFEGSLDSI